MNLRSVKQAWGWVKSHWRFDVPRLVYLRLLPDSLAKPLQRMLWDFLAPWRYERWGHARGDYPVVEVILKAVSPKSLLDAGCGNGRLFPLYLSVDIPKVVGIDISQVSLEIARRAFPASQYPQIEVRCVRLEEMDFDANEFDLCITNRVLQHVPRRNIEQVVRRICHASRFVYVNEYSETDDPDPSFHIAAHPYEDLFERNNFEMVVKDRWGKATYYLFARTGTRSTKKIVMRYRQLASTMLNRQV